MSIQPVLSVFTPTICTWKLLRSEIDLRFRELPRCKQVHPYFLLFQETLIETYADRYIIYTNGSKSKTGVGAAAVWVEETAGVALPGGGIYIYLRDPSNYTSNEEDSRGEIH